MLTLVSLTAVAFSVPSVHLSRVSGVRATMVVAAETSDAAALDAAANVLKASKRFGKPQVAAAQTFVEKALAGEDAVWLMEQKLALFEECQLDDEKGVCKELSAALEGLEEIAAARGGLKQKPTSISAQFDAMFNADPVQKAVARVKKAAAAFGPEQKKAADEWIQKTMSRQISDGGASLLNEQVLLFGECMLSEDGTPSKCETLQSALSEMQEVMSAAAINSFLSDPVNAKPEASLTNPLDGLNPEDYGEAPEGYYYDPWGRLVLTKMGK